MHKPESPTISSLQTVEMVEDVDGVEITMKFEAKVEVIAHIRANKLLSLQTWEATLVIHGMGLIYQT